jgi:hypothetical protein
MEEVGKVPRERCDIGVSRRMVWLIQYPHGIIGMN